MIIDFKKYTNDKIIMRDNKKRYNEHYIITCGTLYKKNGYAYVKDEVFRMIININKLKAKNIDTEFLIFIKNWIGVNNRIKNWSGVHIFNSYTDSNNLYVGSIRYDKLMVIKKKYKSKYTTLACKRLNNSIQLNKWYRIQFIRYNDLLILCYNNEILTTIDTDLKVGTCGIRLDNLECNIDRWMYTII